jgi:hypothetical protein
MLISAFNRITSADGQVQYIEAIDLAMTQDILPGIPSIVLRSDIVRVTGSIKLPGQNLTILCRRLICTDSPTISTAAAGTILSYTNQSATVGGSNGANGGQGVDGGAGGNGGDIAIVVGSLEGALLLDASGQNGGDAQSGGDGANGQPGLDWSPTSGLVAGGNGGNGGQGGLPGKPGNGGSSGKITFHSMQPLSPGQLSTTSKKGNAGGIGRYGAPGAAGRAGSGGTLTQNLWGHCVY